MNIRQSDLRLNHYSLLCRLHRRMRGLGTQMRKGKVDVFHVIGYVNGKSLHDDIGILGSLPICV